MKERQGLTGIIRKTISKGLGLLLLGAVASGCLSRQETDRLVGEIERHNFVDVTVTEPARLCMMNSYYLENLYEVLGEIHPYILENAGEIVLEKSLWDNNFELGIMTILEPYIVGYVPFAPENNGTYKVHIKIRTLPEKILLFTLSSEKDIIVEELFHSLCGHKILVDSLEYKLFFRGFEGKKPGFYGGLPFKILAIFTGIPFFAERSSHHEQVAAVYRHRS